MTDGYLVVGTGCVLLGCGLYYSFLRKEVMRLQAFPKRAWRLNSPVDEVVQVSKQTIVLEAGLSA